jgi:hypothetical protein
MKLDRQYHPMKQYAFYFQALLYDMLQEVSKILEFERRFSTTKGITTHFSHSSFTHMLFEIF